MRLGQSTPAPKLVIDPYDSDVLGGWPGAVTFHDPARWPAGCHVARFVPRDSRDLDAYDAVYAQCFHRNPIWVLTDEAGIVFPSQRPASHWAHQLVTTGRKFEICHVACHTRPVEIDRNLIGQARHVLLWELPLKADRRYVAENIGMDPPDFDQLAVTVRPPAFLRYDSLERTIQPIDPAPL